MSNKKTRANEKFTIRFQKALDLKPDGWAGPITHGALTYFLREHDLDDIRRDLRVDKADKFDVAENNEDFIIRFQSALNLRADGWAGPITDGALTEVLSEQGIPEREWNDVKASSFADPKDIAAFRRCKAQGHSDQYCFSKGDNGIGAWGADTTGDTPMVALPRDDWKKANKRGGAIVLLRYRGGPVQKVVLGDTMPWKRNIKNGAGIDLNPATLELFGMEPPILKDGFSWAWA